MTTAYQRIWDLGQAIARRRVDETDPADYITRRNQLRDILERTGLTAVQEAELHLLEEVCEERCATWYAADCPPEMS